MTTFTPVSALLGGLLIGTAASLLLWLDGRIAGVSGILGRLLPPSRGGAAWRALFLGGLIGGAALFYALHGHAPQARAGFPGALLIAGGLLVGLGTRCLVSDGVSAAIVPARRWHNWQPRTQRPGYSCRLSSSAA